MAKTCKKCRKKVSDKTNLLLCKDHLREYYRKYSKKPSEKERKRKYMREYLKRPYVKERLRKYYRKYSKRPEVKEKKRKYNREYCRRPYVKEKIKRYNREYQRRPDVKERKKRKKREKERSKREYFNSLSENQQHRILWGLTQEILEKKEKENNKIKIKPEEKMEFHGKLDDVVCIGCGHKTRVVFGIPEGYKNPKTLCRICWYDLHGINIEEVK